MVTESERQAIVDEEHLRLLPVFYWVLGAMDAFIGLYGLFYVAMGLIFALTPWDTGASAGSPPPAFMGWFFVMFGLVFTLGFAAIGTLKILAGFWIRGRRRRTACLVAAAISCASMPFGTVVGVLTFMVLLRPSVTAMFTAGVPGSSRTADAAAPAEVA